MSSTLNIVLKSQDSVILNTEGAYCDKNIKIIPQIPTTYTASNVKELPDDAPEGSLAVVKQKSDGLRWKSIGCNHSSPPNPGWTVRSFNMWTDGYNIYYSISDQQYVLNGDTWEIKVWNGLDKLWGSRVWTDGDNIYHYYNGHYILNGDTWETKTWEGFDISFDPAYIWTDGENCYYSRGDSQYVLNGDTWEVKVWNGLDNLSANRVWTDGKKYYYSGDGTHYVLNGDTWEIKVWNGDGLGDIHGGSIWTDGNNIYFSDGTTHYILNGDTWEVLTSTGSLGNVIGAQMKTLLGNTYYGTGQGLYIALKDYEALYTRTNGTWVEKEIY